MAQLLHLQPSSASSIHNLSRAPTRFRSLPPVLVFKRNAGFLVSSASYQNVRASDETERKHSSRIGFLGLGIMGTSMATNLIQAGYNVTVWNRNAQKCELLVERGASCGTSPAEVASTCDITFAMLADPDAAMEVAYGKLGVVHGLGLGKGYVDASTIDGRTSKKICMAVKSTGALFLEAPVSGSKKPAEEGTLIFLTSGDRALYKQAAPMLDVMGKSRFYLGVSGNGAAMKLVVNMIMGSMMASFSEGLVLGEKVGLDPNTIIELLVAGPRTLFYARNSAAYYWNQSYVIAQGAISAPMFASKGPGMLNKDYSTAFPLKHQQKDLRLALEMADSVDQPIPIAAAANEVYKWAKTTGLGNEDFSAVIELLRSKHHNREHYD